MSDLTDYISGAFAGICALAMLLSMLIAYAYDERMLWWHACTLGVALTAQHLLISHLPLAMMLWAAQLALVAQTLIVVVGTAGAMHKPARTLRLLSLIFAFLFGSRLFPQLGLAWFVLPSTGAAGWYLYRDWDQGKPWIYWLALRQAALLAYWLLATASITNKEIYGMAALAVFGFSSYLAMVWKSRLNAENSLRIEARERTDPLTGLLMPRLFSDRIKGALVRSRKLNYSSALMLIRVVNIDKIVAEQAMKNNEAVILGASHAIASTLRQQDAATRLASNRFGVLAEGTALGEASQLATHILARGLRGEEWGLRGSKLDFQIAIMEVGPAELKAQNILFDLEEALDHMRTESTGPRIRMVRHTSVKFAP